MSANADTVIALVQGSAASLTAEIEEALPIPFNDELREAVRQHIEDGIGPVIAGVLVLLAEALVETRDDR
jgi:hypothetical protein